MRLLPKPRISDQLSVCQRRKMEQPSKAFRLGSYLILLYVAFYILYVSVVEGVPEINTFAEHVAFDGTEIEEGHYVEQQSDDHEREKRAVMARCGPDITNWLIRQMNRNMNNNEIKHCRAWYNTFLWPRCLIKFAGLVGNCKPWDFKCTQSFTGRSCPDNCPRTVTLCRKCVNYDVPGNIHYGWVGRAAYIRRWFLLYAANRVQKGGVDDPKDQNAIIIGMDLWDVPSKRSRFCREVRSHISSLNLQGTSGCIRCNTKYN